MIAKVKSCFHMPIITATIRRIAVAISNAKPICCLKNMSARKPVLAVSMLHNSHGSIHRRYTLVISHPSPKNHEVNSGNIQYSIPNDGMPIAKTHSVKRLK